MSRENLLSGKLSAQRIIGEALQVRNESIRRSQHPAMPTYMLVEPSLPSTYSSSGELSKTVEASSSSNSSETVGSVGSSESAESVWSVESVESTEIVKTAESAKSSSLDKHPPSPDLSPVSASLPEYVEARNPSRFASVVSAWSTANLLDSLKTTFSSPAPYNKPYTIGVRYRNSLSPRHFAVGQLTAWPYIGSNPWAKDQLGRRVHRRGTHGICGMLHFKTSDSLGEAFCLVVGINEGKKWCDILVDLTETETIESIHPTYYNLSTPRGLIAFQQAAEVERVTRMGTKLRLQLSLLENHKLVAEFAIRRKRYSEEEIQEVSRQLRMKHSKWIHLPRTYIILRDIAKDNNMVQFIRYGITDSWIPFSRPYLPHGFSKIRCDEIEDAQKSVIPHNFDLENRDHCHLTSQDVDEDDIPKQFQARRFLGSGGFSSVFEVEGTGKKLYALKTISRGENFSETQDTMRYFNSEVEVLQILSREPSRHFIELIGSYTAPSSVGLIMSPVAEMNLADFLARISEMESSTPLKPVYYHEYIHMRKLLCAFFGCLSSALTRLHTVHNIRHKDIKPENILVDLKNENVLFTDFGIAKFWGDINRTTTMQERRRSSLYCAPEAAEVTEHRSSSDIWSLGCVFLEMMTVLKGYTVGSLRETFRSQGSYQREYRNNKVAIAYWMDVLLRDEFPERPNQPLAWIANMLLMDESKRWGADELTMTIRRESRTLSNMKLCGACCIQESPEGAGAEFEAATLGAVRREGTFKYNPSWKEQSRRAQEIVGELKWNDEQGVMKDMELLFRKQELSRKGKLLLHTGAIVGIVSYILMGLVLWGSLHDPAAVQLPGRLPQNNALTLKLSTPTPTMVLKGRKKAKALG